MTTRGPLSGSWMSVDYHLIKRKDKQGKTIYHVAFLDATPGKNGKPRYRSTRTTKTGNIGRARKRAQQMIAEGKVFAAKDSLREFLLDFWDTEKSEYIRGKKAEGRKISPIYTDNSRQLIETYFLPYFEDRGIVKLSSLDRKSLTEWRNTLYEHGRIPRTDETAEPAGAKRISPTTQNKVRQAVFTALQWAVEMEMIPYHPGTGVRRVAEGKTERPIFERKELGKLFGEVSWDDPRAYAACLLAAETGMRLGEVRGLQGKNLHLEEGTLDVLTNYQDKEGLKAPKWDSVRLGVPVSPRCAMALKELLEKRPHDAADDDYVFYSIESRRRPMSKEALGSALAKAIKAAGIPAGRTFHSFRHSWITHASGQLPAHVLQRMVGHTNDATTARYQHISEEQKQAMTEYQANIIQFPKEKTS